MNNLNSLFVVLATLAVIFVPQLLALMLTPDSESVPELVDFD